MDFFDRQAQAQSKTRWLVVYFALAVICIIAVLQVVFAYLLEYPWTSLELLTYVAGGVAVVVTLGSVIKIAELSKGGSAVAAMLGGEPVMQNTTNLDERKLLNIIEEMSIASGVPVPEVYVLPERSINAFAAGHGPGDTAIGVTRGCIERLSRDELQGVIAHEFSHILHGDMKLNVNLIGLLNGILCIALIGAFLTRIAVYAPRGSSRDRDRGALVIFLIAAGAALYLVGWIGVFFGNLIKAAVSRQREFLADASAVQYTRNPQGIATALWKIGKHESKLLSPRAQEASHLYFGNGVGEHWLSWFATHPPIDDRILAIDAHFQPPTETSRPQPPPLPEEKPAAFGQAGANPRWGLPGLAQAGILLASLPGFAGQSVRDLHGACAFVYALLLDEDAGIRQTQLQGLNVDDSLRNETLALFARRGEITVAQRLPLIDLVIPTLRHLSPDLYVVFKANVKHLVESDQQIHLFEYALQKTLIRHLDLSFTRSTGAQVKYRGLPPVLDSVGVILSGLAYVGHTDPAERDAAFAAGVRELLIVSAKQLPRDNSCDLNRIDAALDRVAQSAPDVKRTILKACRETVAHDGKVGTEEYELLRAIADVMDCPMPPLPQEAA